MADSNRLAITEEKIAHYNAQDADAYVALMTDDASEASYRGAVLREGREGVRWDLNPITSYFVTLNLFQGPLGRRRGACRMDANRAGWPANARSARAAKWVLKQVQDDEEKVSRKLCSRVEFVR